MKAWLIDRSGTVASVLAFIALAVAVEAYFLGKIAVVETKSLAVDLWGLIWEVEDR